MTFAQMLLDLKTRIGSTPEVSDTQLKVWINRALLTFCGEDDFGWLEKTVTGSTIALQERYALPTDYKRMVELQVNGSSGSPNPYALTSHELRVNNQPGDKKFSLFADEIYLFPIPSESGDNNISIKYIRRPVEMIQDSDAPSDKTIASMPAEYHEALVIYAFAIYNTYDEEHSEAESLMGSVNSPRPGTYYYFVNMAKEDDSQQKRGQRSKLLSKQEFTGYSYPNATSGGLTVLGR